MTRWLFAVALLMSSFGGVAGAQSSTSTVAFSFNLGVIGWGMPGDQACHSDGGQLLFEANNVRTLVDYSFAGIEGKSSQTKIVFIVGTKTNDVLVFLDNSASLNDKGRSGTASLQFGTGAFHDASGSIGYEFTCTGGCFFGKGNPKGEPFDAILKGTGSLSLPTSIVEAILPTLFPPPPGFFQRWINGKVQMMGGPPASAPPNANIRLGPADTAARSNTGADPFLSISPRWPIVPSTYSAAATCANLLTGCWITIPVETGAMPAFTDTPIIADFHPGNLTAGVYPANIAITVTPNGQSGAPATQNVPATLIITNGGPILQLSETGIQLQAVAGAQHSPLVHAISVSSSAATPLSYQASASTLSGGNWLTVTPASGTASLSSASTVSIAADPAGLAAGSYFGRVDISAPGAVASLESVEVELTVTAEGAAVPTFSTTGLIFVSQESTNPAPQTITVSTLSSQPIALTLGMQEDDAKKWLAVSAPSASLHSSQPITQTVSVSAADRGLTPGVYSGTVIDGVAASKAINQIPVLLIVTPASGVCTPTKLVAVLTNMGAGYAVTAALPVSLQAEILDDCGSPLRAGAVQATFSSGDSAVVMTPLGSGQWSGTWQPHGIRGGAAMVTVIAVSASGLEGSVSALGTIDANTAATVVNPDGIVNAASLVSDAPVSPGGFISIFGSNLAAATAKSNSLPLAMTLAGTQVLLGGQPLPLDFVSPGQINALVPYGTPVNGIQELLVKQNGVYSLPETVVVATANPAVFTEDSSGQGAGVMVVVKADGTEFQASASRPASAGDALVIYCAGLGPVSPAVADGTAAPLLPPSTTVNPVTVTIGGQPARVLFAGLAPGYAGLYQVNVIVPTGVAAGANVPVILTTATFSSAPVTVAIQ